MKRNSTQTRTYRKEGEDESPLAPICRSSLGVVALKLSMSERVIPVKNIQVILRTIISLSITRVVPRATSSLLG